MVHLLVAPSILTRTKIKCCLVALRAFDKTLLEWLKEGFFLTRLACESYERGFFSIVASSSNGANRSTLGTDRRMGTLSGFRVHATLQKNYLEAHFPGARCRR